MNKTEGLIAAPFTPFRPDQSLHLDVIGDYAAWLKQNRVVGAFICGTTGESMSMTTDERRQVAERWMAVAPKDLRVIVHVGHTSLIDACQLATHAQSIGADSVACLAPFFFKPAGVEGMVQWCEQVAAAAPKLPFYYYHIPSITGFSMKVREFLEHAKGRIPNLVGIKYTFEDLDDFGQCLPYDEGRYDMLFGRDELLLSALQLGARGAVGSTYNFAAPLYYSLIEAFDRGDIQRATELQGMAVRMIDAHIQCGAAPIAAFKWYMSQVGIDCGPARMPLLPPTGPQLEKLKAQLAAANIRF